jgi:hypothetical protein
MTIETLFFNMVGFIAAALVTMMFTRLATIAAARRAGYAPVAAKLVELWRVGDPRKHEIFSELTKLVIDGNKDIYPFLDRFIDAINGEANDAESHLLDLLDKMRATSGLAGVRESFLSSGPSQLELFKKLLEK